MKPEGNKHLIQQRLICLVEAENWNTINWEIVCPKGVGKKMNMKATSSFKTHESFESTQNS